MDELLRIDVRLLVLRYGRQKILEALAADDHRTPGDVEAELALAAQRKASRKKKKPVSPSELAVQLCRERPEAARPLETLATRYESRTFLPRLREVERFLEKTGFPHRRLKSRLAAASQVMTALSRMKIEELESLAASPRAQEESDFAMLAREIMGKGESNREP